MLVLVRNISLKILDASKVTPKIASESNIKKTTNSGLIFTLITLSCIFLWSITGPLTTLLQYLPEPIGSHAELFNEGAQTTLLLTLSSGAIGLLIGVLSGLSKLSKHWFCRIPTELFIWVMRGTPLLVQILFAYYALPAIFPWLHLNEFYAAMLALSLNVGAYNAEVVRAGVLAIPIGQKEAALSLGLGHFKTLRWIVLPQAIRIVLPPLVNNLVALLKDSSLASVIGLLELSLVGNRISSETFKPVPVLVTVALVYLMLTSGITIITHFLERGFIVRSKK